MMDYLDAVLEHYDGLIFCVEHYDNVMVDQGKSSKKFSKSRPKNVEKKKDFFCLIDLNGE